MKLANPFFLAIGFILVTLQLSAQISSDTIFLNTAYIVAENEAEIITKETIVHCDYQSIWYCNPWKVSKVEEPVHFSEKRSEDDNSSNEFNLFPNPSTSFFTIQSNSELGWVRILNASGQIVLFEQVASQQWTYQHDLAAGTYFVQTKLEPSEVRKLIVTN